MEENIAKIIAKKKRSIALKQIFKEIGRVILPFLLFLFYSNKKRICLQKLLERT